MGLRERLGLVRDVAQSQSLSPYVGFAAEPVVLPSLTNDVAQVQASIAPVSIAQAFGINLDSDRVTRDQALTIPAVRRGRDVITGVVGTAALRAHTTVTGARVDRPLLAALSSTEPNVVVLTRTLDDLIFNGLAWWRVTSRDTQGYPLTVERIAAARVAIDNGRVRRVRIDGAAVADADVIRFDRDSEGILKQGARTLRTALMLEDAVRRFARLDVPLGLITDSDGSMTPTEVVDLLNSWEAARRQRTTGYLPTGLKYESAALDAQKIELGAARSYAVAEVARLLNLPPNVVNAPAGDSLTYATVEGNRRDLVDLTLRPLLALVEQRLSMPDVTPPGIDVRVDLTRFLLGDTTSVITAGAAAVSAGLMTADEVRTEWLGLSPLGGTA